MRPLRLFDCREAARSQSELLDHPLPLGRWIRLKAHLLICRWCRRYGRQLRFLRQAARRQGEVTAPLGSAQLSAAARERLQRALQNKAS